MKQIFTAFIIFSITLAACDGSTETTTTTTKVVTEKKAKLEDLKKEQEKLNLQIAALEQEIITLDPSQKTRGQTCSRGCYFNAKFRSLYRSSG